MRVYILLFAGLCIFFTSKSYSGQFLEAARAENSPVVDGKGDDLVWKNAKEIIVRDAKAEINISLKALYTDKEIFFLVSFPDPDESRLHKSWVWDKKSKMYKQGLDREDVFVIKWNLLPDPVDLSVYSDSPYKADIWFWKACRTDSGGYADDKIQELSVKKLSKAMKIKSKSGKTMYLHRQGDSGLPAYKTNFYTVYKGDELPRFERQPPSGSRADIKAKGVWADERWTVEFERKLKTGHKDDIQFIPGNKYLFGVSRYEIAGRPPEPESSQPLYGSGDISEKLILVFSSSQEKK